jgi:hypothetical protein
MTAATMIVGLVPVLWSTGICADVMKRIAAPMIGGVVTSFFLELTVYPCAIEHRKLDSLPGPTAPMHAAGGPSLGGNGSLPLFKSSDTVPIPMSDADLKAELQRLKAENKGLKKRGDRAVSLKVSEKGGLSVYGLGSFPVTLCGAHAADPPSHCGRSAVSSARLCTFFVPSRLPVLMPRMTRQPRLLSSPNRRESAPSSEVLR